MNQEKITRTEMICKALRNNKDEYDRVSSKFLDKVDTIREGWDTIQATSKKLSAVFKTKEYTSMEEYIELFRPSYKEVDCIKWYSEDALKMYCDAMNYEM